MVFSSTVFLFFFLPVVLLLYYLACRSRQTKNILLTLASLLFYAWGEPWFVLVMLASIFLNWRFGLAIDHNRDNKPRAKAWLWAMAVVNIALLGVFKYSGFVMRNINAAFSLNLPVPHLSRAPVYVHHVADGLKSEKGNADGQNQVRYRMI